MARITVTIATTLHGEVSVTQHFPELADHGAPSVLDMGNLQKRVAEAAQVAINAHGEARPSFDGQMAEASTTRLRG